MAWLTRTNWTPSQSLHADDINDIGNDLRQWGGNVNGGGFTLYNCLIAGSLTDPTTTLGDILVRGPMALQRLGAGADGLVLVADHTQPLGMKWGAASGGLVDPTIQKGDLIVRGAAAPPTRLSVGLNGQVLMADPAAALGVRWGTISGMSAAGGDKQIQFNQAGPFGANANLIFDYINARLGIANAAPAYRLDLTGDVNITGVYRINGTPFTTAAIQTPWLQNINGGNFQLANVNRVGIATANPLAKLHLGNSNGTSGPPTYRGSIIIDEYNATLAAQAGIEFITRGDGGGYGWRISSLANNADLVYESRSGSAAWTERIRFANGGNIGISTPTPQALVQIGSLSDGAGEANYHGVLLISAPPGTATTAGGIEFKADKNGSGYGWRIVPVLNTTTFLYDLICFSRQNSGAWTEVFRINGQGGLTTILPSTAPAAGSKAFWYDPADGNRVKFVP